MVVEGEFIMEEAEVIHGFGVVVEVVVEVVVVDAVEGINNI